MIVKMKKISVIVQSKESAPAIGELKSLGVLHVEHERLPSGEDIRRLKNDIEQITKAQAILSSFQIPGQKSKAIDAEKPGGWRAKAAHIINSSNRIGQLEEYLRRTANEIKSWEGWGDFDPEKIKKLSEKNIYVRLYEVPAGRVKDFPSGVIVKRISSHKGLARCAVVSRDKAGMPFKELALPKAGPKKMRARLEEDKKVMEQIKGGLRSHVSCRAEFSRIKNELLKDLEFAEALKGMGETGGIMYVTGYAPEKDVKSVSAVAKAKKWGILIKDPSENDAVPTLIRNPKWVSIINPVFKLLEIVPGYRELDISLWFLLFFSVFFGMLIGDAGYGIIFFILTAVFHKKFGARPGGKSIFALFYALSLCAVIWGALTGTFFGQAWLPQAIKPLIPALRNSKNLQALCFLLGAVQLSVAHFWKSIVKLPSVKAAADIGWVGVLWGAFFLAKTLILGDILPGFVKWLFIGGMALVVLFTEPRKNVFKGIGSGVGNLLLNIVNSFTDIVSYIRLFAVGLATVAIADAFNSMAMDVGFGTVVTGILTALILLLGHSLNIILGPLAILVHGVRLNVLEFSSHLDMGWSGVSYRPLKK